MTNEQIEQEISDINSALKDPSIIDSFKNKLHKTLNICITCLHLMKLVKIQDELLNLYDNKAYFNYDMYAKDAKILQKYIQELKEGI
jgi:hypothetical protein